MFFFIPLISAQEQPTGSGPDYTYVYENPEILSFEISMSEEAYQKIQPDQSDMLLQMTQRKRLSSSSMFGMKFNYAPAVVSCENETYENVGIRHRGNASMLLIPPDGKKPYKLDFDRYQKKQNFHGFKKFNFINCFRDPSMLRDKLSYDLMRRVGVPAPHATFAHLYLSLDGNPREYLGLYVVVEQVDKVFLNRHFGNSKGLLIKGEIMNDLDYRGENWEEYAHDFELKSDPEDSDTSLLIQFLKFVNQSSDEQFAQEINSYLNVDRFVKWLAMNTLLSDLDSYAGLGHNWYLYFNTDTKRFEYIPWDVNEAFGNLQLQSQPQQMIDFDIHRPYVGDKILIRRLLAVERFKALYYGYLQIFVVGVFDPETMHKEIDRLHAFIKDAAEKDKNKIYATADFLKSVEETVPPLFPVLSGGIIGLKPFVTQRCASVKAQLIGEQKGFQFDRFQMGDFGGPSDANKSEEPSETTPAGVPVSAGGPATTGAAAALPPGFGGPGDQGMNLPPMQPMTEETKAKVKEMEAQLQEIEALIQNDSQNAALYVQKGQLMGQITEIGGMMEKMKYGMGMKEAFEKAVELDPETIEGHLGRGIIRFFIPQQFGGDPEGALADFQFVLNKEPHHVQANFFWGLYLMRKGDIEKAAAAFHTVLELDPSNKEARRILEQIKSAGAEKK
jgi:tetratricopeptide (TPR) repeat protein